MSIKPLFLLGSTGKLEERLAVATNAALSLHEEATKLNEVVHAQRDRIRDLEGRPERQLLFRIMTLLQNVKHQLRETRPELASDAMALEQGLRNHLKL